MFYEDKATNPCGLCKTLTVLLDPFLIYKYLKGFFFFFFSFKMHESQHTESPVSGERN